MHEVNVFTNEVCIFVFGFFKVIRRKTRLARLTYKRNQTFLDLFAGIHKELEKKNGHF